jgi:hypothetical protein
MIPRTGFGAYSLELQRTSTTILKYFFMQMFKYGQKVGNLVIVPFLMKLVIKVDIFVFKTIQLNLRIEY